MACAFFFSQAHIFIKYRIDHQNYFFCNATFFALYEQNLVFRNILIRNVAQKPHALLSIKFNSLALKNFGCPF